MLYGVQWYLDLMPWNRVAMVAYEQGLAASWSEQVRNYLEWGEGLGLTQVHRTHRAGHDWWTHQDHWKGEPGGVMAVGYQGALEGYGFHLGIIDDMYKLWEEATSKRERERRINWFEGTFYNRRQPGASIVVLMHRWSTMDIVGYLVNEHPDEWTVINLAALIETEDQAADDPLGRSLGEALIPDMWSAEALLQAKRSAGSIRWAGIHQGEPIAEGGNLFKVWDWGVWDTVDRAATNGRKALPSRFDEMAMTMDCNFKDTEDTGDTGRSRVAIQVWARKGADRYLLDEVCSELGFLGSVKAVLGLQRRWPLARRILIERAANGPSVAAALRRQLSGVKLVNAKGSKLSRWVTCQAEKEAGHLYRPPPETHPWSDDFVAECAQARGVRGERNDRVDAMAQLLIRWHGTGSAGDYYDRLLGVLET